MSETTDRIKSLLRDFRIVMSKKYLTLFLLLTQCNVYESEEDCIAYSTLNNIVFGKNFWNYSKKEQFFIVVHELLHVLLLHTSRIKTSGYNAIAYNIVADYIINNNIKSEYKLLNEPEGVINNISQFCDPKIFNYNNDLWKQQSVEQILKKLAQSGKNTLHVKGSGSSKGTYGNGSVSEGANGNGNGLTGDLTKDLSKKAKKVQKASGKEIRSETDLRNMISKTLVTSKLAGKISGTETRLLNELTKIEVKWDDLFNQILTSSLSPKVINTYSRPNRRVEGLPGLYRMVIPKIYAAIDTSGSINHEEYKKFVSLLWNTKKKYGSEIEMLFWDTKVKEVRNLGSIKDALEPVKNVGGGTTISPVLTQISKKRTGTDIVVILSDFYVSDSESQIKTAVQKFPSRSIVCIKTGNGGCLKNQYFRQKIRKVIEI